MVGNEWVGQVKKMLRKAAPPEDRKKKFPDIEADFWPVFDRFQPYTQSNPERAYALYNAVKYLHAANIPGDIVECGVWRGGSCMMLAHLLAELDDTSRKIYLYDTYEGMSEPTRHDFRPRTNTHAQDRWKEYTAKNEKWNFVSIEEVQHNMSLVAYPQSQLFFIKGKVEETIPKMIPHQISLLRLDTDWYESTLHEMEHLYPRLSGGGVLILDDYGSWMGAKAAVDKYLADVSTPTLLNRIDFTGRMSVKT